MAILSGVYRIGKDAELRYLASGVAVTNLSAVSNYGKKQDDGNRKSQWVDFSLFGKQAEVLVQYLKKGTQASITASEPHIEEFTRGDGSTGSKMVANIVNIELVGGNQQSGQQQGYQPPAQQQRPPVQGQQQPRDNFDAPYDDDLPF